MVLPVKRKTPASTSTSKLCDADRKVLEIVKSAQEAGISKPQIKRLTGLSEALANKSINTLIGLNLIKVFAHVTFTRSKHYISVEFNPSKEVAGGHWYSDGIINADYVTAVRRFCLHLITKMGIASVEELSVFNTSKNGAFPQLTGSEIDEIVQALVLDGELEEKIHNSKVCYRRKAAKKVESALASIPCGVCPRINDCTPDGVISPNTCVYMSKWLEF